MQPWRLVTCWLPGKLLTQAAPCTQQHAGHLLTFACAQLPMTVMLMLVLCLLLVVNMMATGMLAWQ